MNNNRPSKFIKHNHSRIRNSVQFRKLYWIH